MLMLQQPWKPRNSVMAQTWRSMRPGATRSPEQSILQSGRSRFPLSTTLPSHTLVGAHVSKNRWLIWFSIPTHPHIFWFYWASPQHCAVCELNKSHFAKRPRMTTIDRSKVCCTLTKESKPKWQEHVVPRSRLAGKIRLTVVAQTGRVCV